MTWYDVASEIADLLRAETSSPLSGATVELGPRLEPPSGLTVYVMPPSTDDPVPIVAIGGETLREFGLLIQVEDAWDDDSSTLETVMNAASQVIDIVESNRTLSTSGAVRGVVQSQGYRWTQRPANPAYNGFAVILTVKYRSE